MKKDKTKLMKDIEDMKIKLASMEEELNKIDEFKHFPSEGDEYYSYTPSGSVYNSNVDNDGLKVNVYKTEEEAKKACNKDIALEKIKRRILELQGDWKPDWSEENEEKICIHYDHYERRLRPVCWFTTQPDTLVPYMKNEEKALTIIKEMEDELNLIFDIRKD